MTSLAQSERRRTAKRGNGEGSIYYQEKDHRWRAAVTLENGKRKLLSGKTRQDVARKLTAALKQQDRGIPFSPERLMLGDFLTKWLEDAAKPKVKPSTYQTYQHYVAAHIVPALGKRPLAKLTPQEVQQLLNDCSAKGLEPRTVQQIHAILRSALNRAMKWELVSRNVATLVDPPRSTTSEIRPLDAQQAQMLLAAAAGHRYEHLYAFLLSTGLRLGEALALRWHHPDGRQLVDLAARRATVLYTLQRLRGEPWKFSEPKSNSGRRTIPLAAPAIAALKAQRQRSAQSGTLWQELDLVFPSAVGTPLDGTNVYHEFKKLLKKAGLPSSYRVHDLRHSAATYLLAARVDPRVVMAVMGWSQVSMLARYQHILPAMLDDAMERLEAVYPGAAVR